MAVSQSLTLTESNVVTSANTSKVRILWQSTQSGESWNGYTKTAKYYVSINGGAETEYLVSYTLPQNATATIVDTSITVNHKTDGTGSVKVRVWMDTGISVGVVTQTKTLNLTTIARASTLDALSCNTAYFNGTMTYKYTPKSSSYYNRCNIALNIDGAYTAVKTINLGQKAASQQTSTVALAESELSIIYNKFPNGKKGTLRFTLRTYSDSGYSTEIGSGDHEEITLTIPNIDATKPTATMSVSPVSTLSSPFNTLYIKGRSKVDANFTNGAGKYGASIVSYKMSVAGKSYGSPYTSEYLTAEGSVTVTGVVTDSRGYSRTYTKTITVLPYANPRIIAASGESEVIAARCDASGNFADSGTYLKIKAKRSYSKVVSAGSQKNFCSIRYRYKADGGSWSSWITILADNATSDEIVTGALLEGALDITKSYSVRVGVVDTFGESEYVSILIPTDKVFWHRAGSMNTLALGKYAELPNTFDVAQDMTSIFRGEVQFKSEAWISRALGTNVTASSVNSGRWGGSGVYYRVLAGGKHIYVAFNVSFTTSSSTVRVESETIPYPPSYDVYALCPVGFSDGSRGIATVSVSPRGRVNIYAVHKLPGATLSTGDTVNWIDGYIDYWT